jgi:hypothetical protein
MRTISTMQASRHDNLMASVASYPPLQKSQGRGTHSFETGNEKRLKGRAIPFREFFLTTGDTGFHRETRCTSKTKTGTVSTVPVLQPLATGEG